MKGFIRELFGRHLLITNTCSSCCMMAVGDTIIQNIEIKRDASQQFEWARTRRMATMGLMLGPMAHFWYRALDRWMVSVTHGNVMRKILLDQFVASPVFAFVFISGMCLQEGQTIRQSLAEFKRKFGYMYIIDWMVWPPCQAINFYYIPPYGRVLFVYLCDTMWSSITSYIKHVDRTKPHVSTAQAQR